MYLLDIITINRFSIYKGIEMCFYPGTLIATCIVYLDLAGVSLVSSNQHLR